MAGLWIALTVGLPWLGALLVWLAGDRRPRTQHATAVAATAAGALAALGLWARGLGRQPVQLAGSSLFGQVVFVPDGLGGLLAAIAAVIGCLAVVFSVDYMRGEAGLGRYYALVLLFIGAMAGLVLTDSLLLLFVFWEITALCSFGLIAFHHDRPAAVAAGLKALYITQAGGLGLLVGALMVYAYTGSYSISGWLGAARPLPAPLLAVAAYGFLGAAMAKSAQVPLHGWLPDAMEAPTPVSALIHAATMVNAGVYLLARFYPVLAEAPGWTMAVQLVGIVSAMLAGGMALAANDLKRVLAYSTISQLGYMVFGIGAGAFVASQFHLLSHAVFKALLFLSAGAVIHAVGTRELKGLGGLGKAMPFTRSAFVCGALALAGVPVLNGFWSKEWLLESAQAQGLPWALAAMLAVGGLTVLYSARVTWLVFFGPAQPRPGVHDAPAWMRVALGWLMALTGTTWLAGGALSQALASTLPHHGAHPTTTLEIVRELLMAPGTYGVLAVTAVGLAVWVGREHLRTWSARLEGLARGAQAGFGLEAVYALVEALVQRAAGWLARTQTGALNWNAAALVGMLAALLVIAAWRYR